MRKARLPALLLTALVLTACSAGAQTQAKRPAGPPPRIGDELVGTRWQAQSIDGQPVPDPALMTIDFLPGGDQVRGQAGCNRFVGPFASRADKVTLGILRQSRLPCRHGRDGPAAAADRHAARALGAPSSATTSWSSTTARARRSASSRARVETGDRVSGAG